MYLRSNSEVLMSNNYRSIKPIIYFIDVWILSGIILAILPVKSRFNNSLDIFCVCLIFVLIVSITAIFWFQKTPIIRIHHYDIKELPERKMVFIIDASSIATLLGNIFLFYDRVFIRGINYSLGLRNARYQWLNSTVSGSALSKIGNLLIPFSYCALFMGIYHWENLVPKKRWQAVIFGFGGQVAIAMLNGGRSNILMAIAFAFVTCIIRKYQGKRMFPKINGKLVLGAIVGIALIRYVSSIFFFDAENDKAYLTQVANMFGYDINPTYISNPLTNLLSQIFLYILHGINFIGAQLKYGGGIADINHNMTFRGIFVLLGRLPGFNYTMELPSYDGGAGNFIALPGEMLNDYGYFGFVVACIFLGILAGDALKYINRGDHNVSNLELTFTIGVFLQLYLSMLGDIIGFGYFLFMVYAMLVMELFSGLKYGFSGWTSLETDLEEELDVL